MTEFGAVDVNALRDGRVETFHGLDCSEDTFRQFREWLTPRMPVVFVSDNPAYDFQWINFRRIADCSQGQFSKPRIPDRGTIKQCRSNHRDFLLFVIRVGASDLCQDRVKPRSQDLVRLFNG